MNNKHANITGSFSITSKMPGLSISLPAKDCITGNKLRRNKRSICNKCYGTRRNYCYKHVKNCLEYRKNALDIALSNASYRETYIDAFIQGYNLYEGKRHKGNAIDTRYFRFHDVGDIQSIQHLELIIAICNSMPDVKFWLPTKEIKIIRQYIKSGGIIPGNLNIRLSNYLVNKTVYFDKTLQALTISTVYDKNNINNTPGIVCKAKNGTCGNCRLCWDKTVKHITHIKH